MDIIALIGRILFALLFLGSAFGHMANAEAMAPYAESKGLPSPKLSVIASGVWLLAGGLFVLLGLWGDLGALMLFVFLLSSGFLFHNFWTVADPQAKQGEQAQFMKNIALAGAALLVFVLYSKDVIGWTVTGPLF
ncbi:DoxX family protein [Pseudonocardiaceae bacterium YIM PH 21723]|nr:DoxX family protein [Pseudonocardiaceae bacterium YIM PH 21723]